MKRIAWLFLFAGCAAPAPRVIDLTHVLEPGIPLYPGATPLSIEKKADLEKDGYYVNAFTVGEHTGTHVDAPLHFVPGTATVDAIPASRLVGPGVVIDVEAKCGDADYRVTAEDVTEFERRHGLIPAGAIVLVRTGWAKRWSDPKAYVNDLHFPGLSAEAARVLIDRRVAGVGIDTLSVDYGPSRAYEVHRLLHGREIYHIENVAGLDRVPDTGATIVVAPLPIKGGSGAPCRIFALVR
ncbi:MAG: cyclase family protein [Planctomycetes bacterium]|nr:cyclase family protein [Planctomycetota bacterium]